MVPASTMETYMMALRGEYCMAMRFGAVEHLPQTCLELLP